MAAELGMGFSPAGGRRIGDAVNKQHSANTTKVLLRLRWALVKASFRTQPVTRWLGLVGGGIYGLGGLALLIGMGIGGLHDIGSKMGPIFVIIASLVMFAWLIGPAVIGPLDESFSAQNLAGFGKTSRQLMPGIVLAGATTGTTILTILAFLVIGTLTVVMGVSAGAAALSIVLAGLFGLIGLVTGTFIAAMGMRAALTLTGTQAKKTRGQRIGRMLAIVIAALGFGAIMYASNATDKIAVNFSPDALAPIGNVLGYTPFGAPAAMAISALNGNYLALAIQLLISVTMVWIIWRVWVLGVKRGLTQMKPPAEVTLRKERSSFQYRIFPKTLVGVQASRVLRSWLRDSRYRRAYITAMGLAVLYQVIGLVNPSFTYMSALVVVLLGIIHMNDMGLDGPARWINDVAHLPAKADIGGRILVGWLISVPLLVIMSVPLAWKTGHLDYLFSVIVMILAVYFSSQASGILLGIYFPVKTQAPGSSMFKAKGGGGSQTLSVAFLSLGSMVGVAIPTAIFVLLGFLSAPMFFIGPLLGLALGLYGLWLAWGIGAKRLEQRRPEIREKVSSWL